jgi:hypothetical protein
LGGKGLHKILLLIIWKGEIMTEIDKLYLAVQTRDEKDAESGDNIRLFSDIDEVARFDQQIPKRGKVALLETEVNLNYREFINNDIQIGITGVDSWAPRMAFLWGRVSKPEEAVRLHHKYVPLASNLFGKPKNVWVSQEIDSGIDRWSLRSFTHIFLINDMEYLVLFIETEAFPIHSAEDWHSVNPNLLTRYLENHLPSIGVNLDKTNFGILVDTIFKLEYSDPFIFDFGTKGPLDCIKRSKPNT